MFIQIDSPLGNITVVENSAALTHVLLRETTPPTGEIEGGTPLLLQAKEQLLQYLAGQRQQFDLPLSPQGTDFQQQVWQALLTIPYGQTRTYGQIAAQIRNPKACRAVGLANNRNPLSIVIPCHRVIGADGSLTGYGGGLDIKARLLELEKNQA